MKNFDDSSVEARRARLYGLVSGISDTIERALASAGIDTRSGPMKSVTATINEALTNAGLMQRAPAPNARGETIDGVAHEIVTPCDDIPPRIAPVIEDDDSAIAPQAPTESVRPGEFSSRWFTNAAGTRSYKLYVPASYSDPSREPVPIVVMLHGCTQSPDDFAAGSRMNALADLHGFLVVYPAQSADANASRCWNWFRAEHQNRDAGEPSIIAGITRDVAAAYRVDTQRIYVAGMSAGAAMAVVLGATYPDLYAAVGAHSGLPYGAAIDLPSALAAMPGHAAASNSVGGQAVGATDRVPTIVFHGDRDHTVNASHAAAILRAAIAVGPDNVPLRARVHEQQAPGGRSYTRTEYIDFDERTVAEQWVLHGAGHAWSGGSPAGSFTDATGPDASAEMIRFFFSQPRRQREIEGAARH